ncbi:MAG: YlxR family protein [Oscillospiraceae bacterium]|jgi:predicted RNA-binding protein YlxR (DUF448 family)|nr:YlxR family protein [Oscillospiraceae bacterium]
MAEKKVVGVRKVPTRQCIGCRAHKEKRALIRVVRPPDDAPITLDATGKKNGRGAYLCPDAECLKKARKKNALSHAFKQRVPEEVYNQLEEELRHLAAAASEKTETREELPYADKI